MKSRYSLKELQQYVDKGEKVDIGFKNNGYHAVIPFCIFSGIDKKNNCIFITSFYINHKGEKVKLENNMLTISYEYILFIGCIFSHIIYEDMR